MIKSANKYIVVLAIGIVCILGYFLKIKNSNDKVVIFDCSQGKSIIATFHLPADKNVSLVLSDGRKLDVPHAMSGSGARYASIDESFVFWNKGNTAFITEGIDKNSTTTYNTCVERGQTADN